MIDISALIAAYAECAAAALFVGGLVWLLGWRPWVPRWTQQEIDEIKARAAKRAAWFRENVE